MVVSASNNANTHSADEDDISVTLQSDFPTKTNAFARISIPKKSFLELCVFLGRTLKAPQVRRIVHASKSKIVHVIHIRHRDEVEAPVTDWLQEAYELSDVLASKAPAARVQSKPRMPKPGSKKKARVRRKTGTIKTVKRR